MTRQEKSGEMSNIIVQDPETIVPRALRYDRGTVTQLVGPEIGARHVDVHINTIRAGSIPGPYHLHTTAENVYYVLRGTATIRSRQSESAVPPGHAVFIPPGVPHAISNRESEDLVIIEIYAPAEADFREVAMEEM